MFRKIRFVLVKSAHSKEGLDEKTPDQPKLEKPKSKNKFLGLFQSSSDPDLNSKSKTRKSFLRRKKNHDKQNKDSQDEAVSETLNNHTERLPDNLLPDGPLPDGPLPDGPLPDGPLQDGSLPDGQLPDSLLPDKTCTDNVVQDSVIVENNIADNFENASQKHSLMDETPLDPLKSMSVSTLGSMQRINRIDIDPFPPDGEAWERAKDVWEKNEIEETKEKDKEKRRTKGKKEHRDKKREGKEGKEEKDGKTRHRSKSRDKDKEHAGKERSDSKNRSKEKKRHEKHEHDESKYEEKRSKDDKHKKHKSKGEKHGGGHKRDTSGGYDSDSELDSKHEHKTDRKHRHKRDHRHKNDSDHERTHDRTLDRTLDRTHDRSHDRTLDRAHDRTLDRTHDRSHDHAHDGTLDRVRAKEHKHHDHPKHKDEKHSKNYEEHHKHSRHKETKTEHKRSKEHTKKPSPYAEHDKIPSPYAEDHKIPSPYAEHDKIPSPYAEDHKIPSPYAKQTKKSGPYAEHDKIPSPYAEDHKRPSPYAEHTKKPSSNAEDHKKLELDKVWREYETGKRYHSQEKDMKKIIDRLDGVERFRREERQRLSDRSHDRSSDTSHEVTHRSRSRERRRRSRSREKQRHESDQDSNHSSTWQYSLTRIEARQEQCKTEIDTARRSIEHRIKQLEMRFEKHYSSSERLPDQPHEKSSAKEPRDYKKIIDQVADECREVTRTLEVRTEEMKSEIATVVREELTHLDEKLHSPTSSSPGPFFGVRVVGNFRCEETTTVDPTKVTRDDDMSKLTASVTSVEPISSADESMVTVIEENSRITRTTPKDCAGAESVSTPPSRDSQVRVSQSGALDTLNEPPGQKHSVSSSTRDSGISADHSMSPLHLRSPGIDNLHELQSLENFEDETHSDEPHEDERHDRDGTQEPLQDVYRRKIKETETRCQERAIEEKEILYRRINELESMLLATREGKGQYV